MILAKITYAIKWLIKIITPIIMKLGLILMIGVCLISTPIVTIVALIISSPFIICILYNQKYIN